MACLANASEKLYQGSAMTCVDLIHDRSRYDHYLDRLHNKTNHYISTGFKELDDMIGGIDRLEENMVIAARTGVGKSWTLIKMAVEAAKQGLCVGIYSGEMSADKVGYRVDTLLGHIDNRAITRCTDMDPATRTAYTHYMDTLPTAGYGSIKILTPNDIQGPATVNALRMFIEKEKLQILLIDQYSLLEDQRGAKTTHEKVANISKDVKNLQVMSRIPIISVSQMNRTKNEDGEQDTTQIGLSDRIGQDATTIIMLSRDITYRDKEKTQIQDEKLILNVVKSRDGGSGKIMYKADFNSGYFVYLDPKLDPMQAESMRSYYEDEDSQESYDDSYGGAPF
jgi:replicative DNA helicase